MAERFYNPAPQYFYTGTPAAPLSGGLMYFYVVGTDTPKDTYSDNGLTTPNTNPVVLSSSGVLPNVFLNGSYKVILTDKNGVQQPGWPRDNVNSPQDLAFLAWDSTFTYGAGGGNIVYASDGNYYISIQTGNTAHEPSASPTWWEKVQFLGTWNPNITYAALDIVEYLGVIYRSNINGNLNNDPSTNDGGAWRSPSYANIQEFSASGTWTRPFVQGLCLVEVWGAGGGGAGGGKNTTGTNRAGGGGGGGGAYKWAVFPLASLTSTAAITIGTGGAGGAGSTSNGVAGSSGGNGGSSTFNVTGFVLTSFGGGGGTATTGGGYGGQLSAAATTTDGYPAAGAGVFSAKGANSSAGAAGPAGPSASRGGGGGGSGGGIDAGDSQLVGGAGGSNTGATGGGGAGGLVTAAGSPGVTLGFGGGGGGSTTATNGGAGGAGGPSGGGGGGGASQDGNGGAGGAGGTGYVRVTSW